MNPQQLAIRAARTGVRFDPWLLLCQMAGRGMSQTQLALGAKITTSAVTYHLQKQGSAPKAKVLQAMAKALDCKVEALQSDGETREANALLMAQWLADDRPHVGEWLEKQQLLALPRRAGCGE